MPITPTDIERLRMDGAVLIKGLFTDWVDTLRAGVERNLAEPGEYAAENLHAHERGRFFEGISAYRGSLSGRRSSPSSRLGGGIS